MSGVVSFSTAILLVVCFWHKPSEFLIFVIHLPRPIVGAGSAGAVIATRLSEDADKKVLLLEAGGEEDSHPATHVPLFCGALQKTPIDWQYRTEPQKNACLSLKNQVSIMHSIIGICSLSL